MLGSMEYIIYFYGSVIRLSLEDYKFKTLKPFGGFGVRADEIERLFLLTL